MSSAAAQECRICLSDGGGDDFMSQCQCISVHKECLSKWLVISNTTVCDLCKMPIKITVDYLPIWRWQYFKEIKGISILYLLISICIFLMTIIFFFSFFHNVPITLYINLICLLASFLTLFGIILVKVYYNGKHMNRQILIQ